MIKVIYPGRKFKKHYKRLPQRIKKQAVQKEKIFINNPFDPRLETHKLKGELKELHSYSISQEYRILFKFITKGKVIYYDIGTHGIYK